MKVAIVGGGIMGRVLAWQLCQQQSWGQSGNELVLYDRDGINAGAAAAYTAAGMLAPYAELESAELDIYHMGMAALALWPNIVASLNSEVDFQQRGSLVLAHAGDDVELQRFEQQLNNKLTEQQHYVALDKPGLQQKEPELMARFEQALYLPQEAWIDNIKTLAALANYLVARGIEWREYTEVERVEPGLVYQKNKSTAYDWVIDCRGLGAKHQLPGGHNVRGVRGELIELHAPEVNIKHLCRLMHPRYRLYLVPRKNQHYLIGASQIESDDQGPITVRSSLELLSAVYSMHPGFSEARVINSRVNCRPALADNKPAVFAQAGLLQINGLYRHGFLLAPIIAAEVQQYLLLALEYPSHRTTTDFIFRSNYPSLFHLSEAVT